MDNSSSERIKILFTSWENHVNNNGILIDWERILYVPRSHFTQWYIHNIDKPNSTSKNKNKFSNCTLKYVFFIFNSLSGEESFLSIKAMKNVTTNRLNRLSYSKVTNFCMSKKILKDKRQKKWRKFSQYTMDFSIK